MDLLIELIVWVFKSLFGDPEAPADMQKRGGAQGGSRTPGKRGPYSYGDSGGGRRPKTLEEILEEVRREAAQKRGGGAPAAQPVPQQIEEPPVPQQTVAQRTFKSSLEDRTEPAAKREGRHESVQTVQVTDTVKKMDAVLERYAPHDAVVMMSDEVKEAKKSKKSAKRAPAVAAAVTPDAGTSIALIRRIREAPSTQKVLAAREAIIVSEVFGPPRSRRPHVPGRRMF